MTRGGLRQNNKSDSNHLFKPKWRLGKTTAIRIPEVLKNTLLEIAKHLDKTKLSLDKDANILDDIVNCFLYKERSQKYRNVIVELRTEKRELIHELNQKSKQNSHKNQLNKYQIAVECFEEFLKSQNLNVEELSKARKGSKKHQLWIIYQWLKTHE